jgi:predicted dienelactone hydrolase
LTEHLASQGFVVMAIDHEDNVRTSGYVHAELTLNSRPMNITWEIDLAEELTTTNGETMGGMIDTNRIAVVGYSWGATTALFAGGARANYTGPTSFCSLYPDLYFPGDTLPTEEVCAEQAQGVADLLGWDAVPEGLWPSWGDPRLDAVVALAPDITNLSAESLSGITTPTMLMAGSQDTWILSELPEYQPYLYDNLGSAIKSMLLFNAADHMIFNSDCKAIPWMLQYDFNNCADSVWDMDRAHDLINHFTTAFLLDTLKGDEAAHAALAPDAVAFPGITYQAEGF